MKNKKTIILVISICAIIAAFSYWYTHSKKTDNTKTPAILVATAPVTSIIQPNQINTTGNLVAKQSTMISSKVSGFVTSINYNEGDKVHSGTLLVQLDNRNEKNALASAKATADLNALQYQRDTKLLKRGLIQQETYYKAKVDNETSQALLLKAESDLSDKSIRAPFDGTIGALTISIGDYISAGNPIVSLVDTSHLRVEYSLPAHYQDQITLGQMVSISNPNTNGSNITGHVSFIAPEIDTNSQTISIHALIDNSDNTLKPGGFVKIEQTLGKPRPILVVPTTSIIASLNGYYVYTIEDNKAVKTPVQIGQSLKNVTEIRSGLSKNQQIIVAGQEQLQPGSLVQRKEP